MSSGPSLGRPRCDDSSTFAPFSIRYLTVGTDARMRVSSVIVLPSSGTFRSQRTRTTLPFRSASERSPTDFLAISIDDARATRDEEMRENAVVGALNASEPEASASIVSFLYRSCAVEGSEINDA